MRRISRVTLALIVATAAAGAAPPAAAASADGAADRPLLSRLFDRLLGPFLALGGSEEREPNTVPPPAAPAEGEQDGGPQSDPDGLSAPGGTDSDPDGLGVSGGTAPPPSSPAEG